jgi:hypothetical protein
MNQIFFLFLLFIGFSYAKAQDLPLFFDTAHVFLQKYVKNGSVDYLSIQKKPQQLDNLLNMIAKVEVKKVAENEKKAFWINAYNILVIKGIIDNYPLESPKNVKGFYNQIRYTVAKEQMTLDELKRNKLQQAYEEDAYLHFVLVGGTKSLPLLANFAYTPENLSELMLSQTNNTINNPLFIRIDEKKKIIYVSEIFRWYPKVFDLNGGIRAFINKHRDFPLPVAYRIEFYASNPKLNDKIR